MKITQALLVLSFTAPCLAQTTCFTDPQGSTICSSPEGVIRGTTNSTGYSVYRDDRGNRLDYDVDSLGRSSIQLPSGDSINWSQSVPAGREELPGSRLHDRSTLRPGPRLPGPLADE